MPTFKEPFSLFPTSLWVILIYQMSCPFNIHQELRTASTYHVWGRRKSIRTVMKQSGHLWNKKWRNLFMNSGSCCCKQPTGNLAKKWQEVWEWEKFTGYEDRFVCSSPAGAKSLEECKMTAPPDFVQCCAA